MNVPKIYCIHVPLPRSDFRKLNITSCGERSYHDRNVLLQYIRWLLTLAAIEYPLSVFPSNLINAVTQNLKLNTSILLNFVKQGVGLGVIPNYLLKGSSHQELLKVTHTFSTEKSMYVAYPYQYPLPRKLAEISSFIRLELTAILGEK